MRKIARITKIMLALVCGVIVLTGCNDYHEPAFAQLPQNYIKFETYGWQSPDVEEDGCLAFDYNGRTYLYYGDTTFYYDENVLSVNTVGVAGKIGSDLVFGLGLQPYDVKECLGCIVQDGWNPGEREVREDERVLSLTYSDADDYLILYRVGYGADFMSPFPSVYRAMDTRGKEIETPSYITPQIPDNPMYAYWAAGNEETAA